MERRDDATFMRTALALARRGAGRVSPNPMVGAVLVRDGAVVATGFHHAAGMDHAEVDALSRVGFDATGCDLYVNLEPCCHQGRTPPCTERLKASGIRRVVAAMVDPNPVVAGRGIAALRDAGIPVDVGVLESEARRLNAPFAKWVTTRRPFVTLKMAATLDGRVAARDGSARWISSEASRRLVHRLRAESDCVMVGSGTAVADDPLLLPASARTSRRPLRVVIDVDGRLSAGSKLAKTTRDGPVLAVETALASPERLTALREAGVEVMMVPADGTGASLAETIDRLGAREVTSAFVEGGPTVAASLLAGGLVDRLLIFFAPMLLGDPLAIPLVADMGIRALAGARRFAITRTFRCGPDIVVESEPIP